MHKALFAGAVSVTLLASLAAAPAAGAAEEERGKLKICVDDGGPLKVFADGPSLRTATLNDSCKTFKVLVGQYNVGPEGFGIFPVDGGDEDACFPGQTTVRRGKRTYQSGPSVLTNVTAGDKTVVRFTCSEPPTFPEPQPVPSMR